jgi:hypothetical protein
MRIFSTGNPMTKLPLYIRNLIDLRNGDQRIHIVAIHSSGDVIVVNPKRDMYGGLARRFFDFLLELKECLDADRMSKMNQASSEGFRTKEDLSDLLDLEPETVRKYFREIQQLLKEFGIDAAEEVFEKRNAKYACAYRVRKDSVVIKSRPRRHAKVRPRGQSLGS